MTHFISVGGFGCLFHSCPDADAFAARLRKARQAAGPIPREAGASTLEVQHAALVRVARQALSDARLPAARRICVIAAADAEAPYAPPPGADALSAIFSAAVAGPHEPAQARLASSTAAALDLAQDMLTTDQADAALVLACSVLEGAPPPSVDGAFSLPFEAAGAAPPPAEGAAAVLLVGSEQDDRGRARLKAGARSERGARGLETALREASSAAGWSGAEAGLIAVTGRKSAAVTEATACARVYERGPRETALASVRSNVGDAGAAADLAGFIAAAMCLERAMTPPLAGWTAAGPVALREAGGLYALEEARLWITSEAHPVRRALVALADADGSAAAIAMEAGPKCAPVAVTAVSAERPLLAPLSGADPAALEAGLDALAAKLTAETDLPALAREAMAQAAASAGAPQRLSLVAASPKELAREIGFMKKGLAKAAATGKPVRTPNGSVYTPAPIGGDAKVAFVFPGNGSAYIGLGREILLSFARHTAAVEPILNRRLGTLLRTDLTYPKSMARLTEADHAALAEELNQDTASLPLLSIAFGVAHSLFLRGALGVQPDMALGYSIGELSMRIALGQWTDWRSLEQQLTHPCLQSGLVGEMTVVDEFWRARGVARPAGGEKWTNYVLKALPEDVLAATQRIENVFVTAVNAPEEVVVAGAPEACARLMTETGALGIPLGFGVAIHSPPAETVIEQLYDLCDNPCRDVPGIAFYSAHGCAPTAPDQDEVATALSRMLASCLDFRSLVEATYADGARVYIETGVRNNCTNWVTATLGDRPHLAVAMDIKGLPSDVAMMRAVAQLYANHVPVDFRELIDPEIDADSNGVEKILETVRA